MPGLVGIVSSKSKNTVIEELLPMMCQSIKHETWHKTDAYVSKAVGLGRIHLGIFNPEPQPIFNEDKTLCIIMDGEIYDYQNAKQELISQGHRFSINNDPEFILHLYEEYGKDFVHKLNGSFTLIIWCEKSRNLLIINDRYGLRPLYYTERNGYLIFGSEVKAILQDQTFERKVDDRAVVDFFSFGYILGSKTFFQGIELLPPASIMTYDTDKVSIEHYWSFNFNEEHKEYPEEYYIEKLSELILQAVKRQMKGKHRIGVPLSGGLDSRTTVASIPKKYYPVHTFTFGKPNCRDAIIAKKVANKLGAVHHFFELKPSDLVSDAEKAVYITDGMLNCIHAFRIQTYTEMREFIDVGLSGLAGDLIIGGSYLTNEILTAKNDNEFTHAVYNIMMGEFNEEFISGLFDKTYYKSISYTVFESFKQLLQNYNNKLYANRSDHFFLHLSRVTRFTINGLVIMHNQLEYRCPFYDNDFIDFIVTIPVNLRVNSRIYRKTLKRMFPDISHIPWQKTGLPITPTNWQIRIHERLKDFKERINRITGGRFPKDTKHFADYDNWMRNDKKLRGYILNILLDKRTLERHYFNQKQIKEILDSHMNGEKNYSELIGRLLTFELWHRI
jgi:asparagine synthase (glutamine-hydrolysing)